MHISKINIAHNSEKVKVSHLRLFQEQSRIIKTFHLQTNQKFNLNNDSKSNLKRTNNISGTDDF